MLGRKLVPVPHPYFMLSMGPPIPAGGSFYQELLQSILSRLIPIVPGTIS